MESLSKLSKYNCLIQQLQQFCDEPVDIVSLLANTTSLLHFTFAFWWTGFYRVAGNQLVLSAFQGPVACTTIAFGRGVCGSAWKESRTIVVPDVEKFPGHIACSSQSRSEIVVPVFSSNGIWGVIDIDSRELGTFDDTDRKYLEVIAKRVGDTIGSMTSPIRDIYLAGGCFWGTQHYLSMLHGVVFTETGFANGNVEKPTYDQVYTDTTGYAETVHVRYDSSILSLSRLLEMFFKTIDPTSLNRQANDVGTRYRTGVYYTCSDDLPIIRDAFNKLSAEINQSDDKSGKKNELAVELTPLLSFYPADEYHQNYLKKHPDGYCHIPAELFSQAGMSKKPQSF